MDFLLIANYLASPLFYYSYFKHKLPRERKQRRFRSTIASRSRNKINEDITEEFNGEGDDGDEDDNDDDEGSLLTLFLNRIASLSCYKTEQSFSVFWSLLYL